MWIPRMLVNEDYKHCILIRLDFIVNIKFGVWKVQLNMLSYLENFSCKSLRVSPKMSSLVTTRLSSNEVIVLRTLFTILDCLENLKSEKNDSIATHVRYYKHFFCIIFWFLLCNAFLLLHNNFLVLADTDILLVAWTAVWITT